MSKPFPAAKCCATHAANRSARLGVPVCIHGSLTGAQVHATVGGEFGRTVSFRGDTYTEIAGNGWRLWVDRR